jgi:hypothetical protein
MKLIKFSSLKKIRSIKSLYGIIYLTIFWLLYFKDIFLKKVTFFLFFDNVEQFYPWYQKINYAINNGYIPLWDNNVLGGHSFVGEFQAGALYLPNLIFTFIFGSKDGISTFSLDILVAIHFLWMSLGMYFLLKSYSFDNIASIIGSLAFSYFGTTITRAPAQSAIFFGLTYVPWVLFTINLFYKYKAKKYLFLTGLLLSLQIYSGHIQPFFHTSLMVAFFGLYKSFYPLNTIKFQYLFEKIKKYTLNMLIVFLVGISLSLPQLFLSLQYLGNAYRWFGPSFVGPGDKIPYGVFGYLYTIDPKQLLNLIDHKIFVDDGNNLYIGIVLFVVSLIGVYFLFNNKSKNSDHEARFWGISSLVALLITLGHKSFLTAVIYIIPLLDKVRQTGRYVIIFHLGISVVIAYAIYSLKNNLNNIKLSTRLIFLSVASYIFLNSIFMRFVIQKNALTEYDFAQWVILSIVIFAIAFVDKFKKYLILTILGAITLSTFFAKEIYVPDINNRPSYPETYFASNNIIQFLESQNEQFRIYNYEFALPRNIGDVYDIQTILGHGATMYKPYYDFLMQDISFDSKNLNYLNVKYIVSNKVLDDDSLKFVMQSEDDKFYLYERKEYYPRVFSSKFLESQNEDVIENIDLVKYTDHHISYKLELNSSDEIIFSEVYYPGWRAYVNGKPKPIKKHEIFRSLELEPGLSLVEFRYEPFKLF